LIAARVLKVDEFVTLQVEHNIPLLTISLGMAGKVTEDEAFFRYLDETMHQYLMTNKIHTTFIGKWYSLPGFVVEKIKKIVDETRDFDSFFLNVCINYDGQEEIVDACRVIIRKIIDQKLDFDSVDKEKIKENIYSSYLVSPDMIVEPGTLFTGTFLWDSKNSRVYFANKDIDTFSKSDIMKALEYFKKT
jgi:undecaprenyl diphosphate synthase